MVVSSSQLAAQSRLGKIMAELQKVHCTFCDQTFLTFDVSEQCPLCRKPGGLRVRTTPNSDAGKSEPIEPEDDKTRTFSSLDSDRETLKAFYDSGELRIEMSVVYGIDGRLVPDGLYTTFYPNGKKQMEIRFVLGSPEGKLFAWYENGQKQVESDYYKGRMHGKSTAWHENGCRYSEFECREGKMHGRMIQWFPNGQKWQEGELQDGKSYGRWEMWDSNGHYTGGSEYIDDETIKLILPDGSEVVQRNDERRREWLEFLFLSMFPGASPPDTTPPPPNFDQRIIWQAFTDAGRNLFADPERLQDAENLIISAAAVAATFGPDNHELGESLYDLGPVYSREGRHSEASVAFERSLYIFERTLGPAHPGVATNLQFLATEYLHQGKQDIAESLLKKAIDILQQPSGDEHPSVVNARAAMASATPRGSRK